MFVQGSSTPKDDEVLFSSLAKVQEKIFSYPPEGVLALTKDRRLVFINRSGILYDWPIAEITNVRSPWYLLGEAFRCEVGGCKYWVYFNKLSSTARSGMLLRGAGVAGDVLALAGAVKGMMDIASARGLCSDWKTMLATAQQSPAPAE